MINILCRYMMIRLGVKVRYNSAAKYQTSASASPPVRALTIHLRTSKQNWPRFKSCLAKLFVPCSPKLAILFVKNPTSPLRFSSLYLSYPLTFPSSQGRAEGFWTRGAPRFFGKCNRHIYDRAENFFSRQFNNPPKRV